MLAIPEYYGAYFKVESNSNRRKVSFLALQSRLIRLVNLRIKSGEFTERGLAKILGISQSQVHNVLKGARRLQPELADHLMSRFDMGVLDLLETGELNGKVSSRGHESATAPDRCFQEPGTHTPLSKATDSRKIGPTPARFNLPRAKVA
ncbi:MAG: hypothetical protein ACR2IV_04765 [Bryobacteraceae bacterium]